ncbi:MAG: NusG domain II-containing protein [Clostridia bacterium]|nr:NusG domain II-containing protein [Clostridia bacterium]MBQ8513557.1 NusG domain II-containing protein [Clostridia bacterium]
MNNNRRILTVRDAVILCFILVLLCILILYPGQTSGGAYAVIATDGETAARLPLDRDGTYTFPQTGDMVFTVENGAVSVTASGCGDLTCVRTGAISSPGEAIVCVPNRTAVTVEGAETSDDLDVVLK